MKNAGGTFAEKSGGLSHSKKEGEGLQKEPLAEEIIIGMPEGKKGIFSVSSRHISGEAVPLLAHMGGRIFIGKHYLEARAGDKIGKEGQRAAKVIIWETKAPENAGGTNSEERGEIKKEFELFEGEEKRFQLEGIGCRMKITRCAWEADHDADTQPYINIDEKLLSGRREKCREMKFSTLNRGDSMDLEGGYRLRYFGKDPEGNAFMDIVDRNNRCVEEFEGGVGDEFEVRLSGIEEVFILRLMKVKNWEGGIDALWFPKAENKGVK